MNSNIGAADRSADQRERGGCPAEVLVDSAKIPSMGTLYLVGTPIGNLEDITLRALRILAAVDLIAAEDTRHSRKLLQHYEIARPLVSYYEHNKLARGAEIMAALEGGDVALISDAGMPGLSDPGYELVGAALQAGHQVSPIPGPSAPIAALVASGLPTDSFVYLGYLPRRSTERRKLLRSLADEGRTLVLFETPHRLAAALDDLAEILGPERPMVAAREITKLHEEFLRGSIGEVQQRCRQQTLRGEFTLIVSGAPPSGSWSEAAVRTRFAELLEAGATRSAAARQTAAESDWPRSDVYRLALDGEE